MRIFRVFMVGFVLASGHWVLATLQTTAQSANVSVGVADTFLTVKGYTSPSALVSVQEGSSTLATTSSDISGYFATTLPAQTPGIRNITVNSTTPTQHTTDNVTKNVDVAEHTSTEVNFFLPPTIENYKSSVVKGVDLTVQGSGLPGSTLSLVIDSKHSFTTVINQNGNWTINIPTGTLSTTAHSFSAILSASNGQLSDKTVPRTFKVTAPGTSRSDTPTTPITDAIVENPIIAFAFLSPFLSGIGWFLAQFVESHFRLLAPNIFLYWWQIIIFVLIILSVITFLIISAIRRSNEDE